MTLVRIAALVVIGAPTFAFAQVSAPARTIEFRFTPTARTQIALWIENPDGTFMATVGLTQSVGLRGIGNRPGAAQMNSGFRWPYGRREGVLPIWAHRRAAAPGAGQFRRVIFQDRVSEGDSSSTSGDSSIDSYFCLSFNPIRSGKDQLDAVTCASTFTSDKGRFFLDADLAKDYAEPAVISTGTGTGTGVGTGAGIGMQGLMRPLSLSSLYPPRRDVVPCTACLDTPDVAQYSEHARQVMPDIDIVTMATPPGGVPQAILFTTPDAWPDGDYVAWIEVNVEGDYNKTFNAETYPTPKAPDGAWDSWSLTFGYPYRGQPSVVFQVPFHLGASGTYGTAQPVFHGDVDGFDPGGGDLHSIDDGTITDDPTSVDSIGSGADRLRLTASGDARFQVTVRGAEVCKTHAPPGPPTGVTARPVDDAKHSHQWGRLHFVVPPSEEPIAHYEVRTSQSAITSMSPSSFARALPGVAANAEADALMIPTDAAAGTGIDVDFGGMGPLTHYFVAIRAVDTCNVAGRYAVAELTTTRINFTQLSGCFVATAAYGTALQPEVQALRTVRDALYPRSPLFAVATDLYYRSGPAAAAVIARSRLARAMTRTLLRPVVQLAHSASLFIAPKRN
jgi:hypothetical protein